MPIASRRYAGGRGLLVTPLLNGGIQVASRGLDLREAVVLVLTGFRVEQTVMGQAHPCQVVFCPVGSIPIEMSNLAVLFFQVAIQVKTEHAPSAAVDQNRCFAVHRDILSRRFLLDRHRRLYTGRYHSVQRGCEPSPNPVWRSSTSGRSTDPAKRPSHQDLGNGDGSRGAKRLFDGVGIFGDDREQNPRRAFRPPMTLFPVLNRIQRETEPCGELCLT